MNISHELWAETFKPIPNPYRQTTGFNYGRGNTLLTYVDFQMLCKENDIDPSRQWTLIEDDAGQAIAQGALWMNAKGYFITEQTPLFSFTKDIPVIIQ